MGKGVEASPWPLHRRSAVTGLLSVALHAAAVWLSTGGPTPTAQTTMLANVVPSGSWPSGAFVEVEAAANAAVSSAATPAQRPSMPAAKPHVRRTPSPAVQRNVSPTGIAASAIGEQSAQGTQATAPGPAAGKAAASSRSLLSAPRHGLGGGMGSGVGVGEGTGQGSPVRALSERWNCPWPREADSETLDEQVVMLKVTVRPDGSVESARLLSDPGLGFGLAALACAKRSRFQPARSPQGQPLLAASPPIRVRFTR